MLPPHPFQPSISPCPLSPAGESSGGKPQQAPEGTSDAAVTKFDVASRRVWWEEAGGECPFPPVLQFRPQSCPPNHRPCLPLLAPLPFRVVLFNEPPSHMALLPPHPHPPDSPLQRAPFPHGRRRRAHRGGVQRGSRHRQAARGRGRCARVPEGRASSTTPTAQRTVVSAPDPPGLPGLQGAAATRSAAGTDLPERGGAPVAVGRPVASPAGLLRTAGRNWFVAVRCSRDLWWPGAWWLAICYVVAMLRAVCVACCGARYYYATFT
eukprot:scaffold10764_cov106-Isochrysis_galbana.AAC.2